jgi:hypothetical protein
MFIFYFLQSYPKALIPTEVETTPEIKKQAPNLARPFL